MKSKIIFSCKILLIVFILFFIFVPFLYLVNLSFFPVNNFSFSFGEFSFKNFIKLFCDAGFGTALFNSVVNSIISVFISIAAGLGTSYVLSRARFKFALKKPLVFWTLLVRVLPPVAFVIPLYTMFNSFGLLPTRLPIILSCILINLPLIIWFMLSFFSSIPEEIEESAKIDGATDIQIYLKIILPLTLPGIAAVAMLSFIYAWNEYTYSVIFTRSPSKYTIPLALSLLNTEDNVTDFGLVAAGGIMSFLPILLFVIFAQKYLISGLSGGAVKE